MHTKTDTAFTYAASIKYGYLKQWYPWSQDIMKIMQMAIPIARDMMDLPAYQLHNHSLRQIVWLR